MQVPIDLRYSKTMNKATKKRTDIIPFGHGSTENNAPMVSRALRT